MNFFNLGIPEIIFIIIIALIIFGPGNMVKTAKEAGTFIRKVTKSPYWKEVWATRRELNELPKMLAKEAQLDETIKDLNKETKEITSSVASTVSEFIKEVDEPVKKSSASAKESAAPPNAAVQTAESKATAAEPAADKPAADVSSAKPAEEAAPAEKSVKSRGKKKG
jgi:Sec-independent protein translocase protein TatA